LSPDSEVVVIVALITNPKSSNNRFRIQIGTNQLTPQAFGRFITRLLSLLLYNLPAGPAPGNVSHSTIPLTRK